MRPLILALLISLIGFASAGTKVYTTGDDFYYRLFVTNYDYSEQLEVACEDTVEVVSQRNSLEEAHEFLAAVRSEFQTDALLTCEATAISGQPFFVTWEFAYIVDGFQHEIDYGQVLEVNGSTGRLRPGARARVLIALPEAQRGEEFVLYYEDDNIEVTLQSLEDLGLE